MRLLLVVLCLSSVPSSAWAKGMTSPERVTCSIAAALKFRLPPELLLAVAEMEGGKPGQWVRNANGSHDVGPMQFNTKYLAHLEKQYGITASDVATAGCYPYEVAAWRLRRHLDRDRGDLWMRAANYHSRAVAHNAKYRRKLIAKAARWQSWLHNNYASTGADSARDLAPKRPKVAAVRAARSQKTQAVEVVLAPDERELLGQLGAQAVVASSRSSGKPHAGRLEGAVQVPAHLGYRVLNAKRAWGTAQAVDWLVAAFDALLSIDAHAPAVQIHDMSLRFGGVMAGHRSHQSGRDVDVTYFTRSCRRSCGPGRVEPHELDAARQWELLAYWLKREQLEFAFIDHALQKPLFEAARTSGAAPSELARWFQYPRSATTSAGLIRHVPNHADHIHLRFRCTYDDPVCLGRRDADLAAEAGPSESEADLHDLLE